MNKIVMFYGSDRAFEAIIPSSYRKLSDVAMQMDAENKQIPLVLVGFCSMEILELVKRKQRSSLQKKLVDKF